MLFPVLPGDSLLFVAGMVVAAGGKDDIDSSPRCGSCCCSSRSPRSSAARSATGSAGTSGRRCSNPTPASSRSATSPRRTGSSEKVRPDHHLPGTFRADRAHARPIVAGAAKMKFAVFTFYNVLGAIVWGAGITLLGYWLGRFEIVQKLIEPIFILIVVLSVAPDGVGVVPPQACRQNNRRPRHGTPRPPRTPSDVGYRA